MMPLRTLLLLLLITPLGSGKSISTTRLQETPTQARIGWIVEIKGAAFLKPSSSDKDFTLDAAKHLFQQLDEGDAVRCSRGGLLKLQIGEKIKEVNSQEWVVLHKPPTPDPDIDRALQSYGHIGGRDRLMNSAIFEPAPGSFVRVEWLSFRWRPDPKLGAISLIVSNRFGKELWRQDGISGTLGSFSSSSARAALMQSRDNRQGLFLTILAENGTKAESPFFLLSAQTEKALDYDLRKTHLGKNDFANHVIRAYWFDRYGLCAQTSQEYEAALALAPESRDLLTATIQAERCTGNTERIKALEERLAAAEHQ